MQKSKIAHDNIVAKKNDLVPMMCRFQLSELRLIAYCLAHYDSRAADTRTFQASVQELTKIFPSMNKKSAYRVVKEAMLKINKKPIEFRENNKKKFYNWFSGFTYSETEGIFEFSVNQDILPLFQELSENFTRYKLKDVYQFRRPTAWKLYENVKHRLFDREKGDWQVELDELKGLLGVAGKYSSWHDFKKWILSPCAEEINKVSDLNIQFFPEKERGRVVAIIFLIAKKDPVKDDKTIDFVRYPQKTLGRLLGAGINKTNAMKLIDMANVAGKDIEHFLEKVSARYARKKEKGSKPAYIYRALYSEFSQNTLF